MKNKKGAAKPQNERNIYNSYIKNSSNESPTLSELPEDLRPSAIPYVESKQKKLPVLKPSPRKRIKNFWKKNWLSGVSLFVAILIAVIPNIVNTKVSVAKIEKDIEYMKTAVSELKTSEDNIIEINQRLISVEEKLYAGNIESIKALEREVEYLKGYIEGQK